MTELKCESVIGVPIALPVSCDNMVHPRHVCVFAVVLLSSADGTLANMIKVSAINGCRVLVY